VGWGSALVEQHDMAPRPGIGVTGLTALRSGWCRRGEMAGEHEHRAGEQYVRAPEHWTSVDVVAMTAPQVLPRIARDCPMTHRSQHGMPGTTIAHHPGDRGGRRGEGRAPRCVSRCVGYWFRPSSRRRRVTTGERTGDGPVTCRFWILVVAAGTRHVPGGWDDADPGRLCRRRRLGRHRDVASTGGRVAAGPRHAGQAGRSGAHVARVTKDSRPW